MSTGQYEQPSAAKPRDLRPDLATAGQHTTKKRKAVGDENEAQVRVYPNNVHSFPG